MTGSSSKFASSARRHRRRASAPQTHTHTIPIPSHSPDFSPITSSCPPLGLITLYVVFYRYLGLVPPPRLCSCVLFSCAAVLWPPISSASWLVSCSSGLDTFPIVLTPPCMCGPPTLKKGFGQLEPWQLYVDGMACDFVSVDKRQKFLFKTNWLGCQSIQMEPI